MSYIEKCNEEIRAERTRYMGQMLNRMYKQKCTKCGCSDLEWEEQINYENRNKVLFVAKCPECGIALGYNFPSPEKVTGRYLTKGGAQFPSESNRDWCAGVLY